MFNSREWAMLVWLAVLAGLGSRSAEFRASAVGVVRALAKIAVVVPLLAYAGWVAGELWVGSWLGIWDPSLTKDAVLWFVVSGLGMFFNYDDVAREPRYFRRRLLAAAGLMVFVEVYLNLFVLGFVAEFILQPVIVMLTLVEVVANSDERYADVKRFVNWTLALIGFALLGYVTVKTIGHWSALDKVALMRQFATPVWLAAGAVPFVYAFGLFVQYDTAFRRIDWASSAGWLTRVQIKAAILVAFHLRAHHLARFSGRWQLQLADAGTFAEAWQIVDRFKSTQT